MDGNLAAITLKQVSDSKIKIFLDRPLAKLLSAHTLSVWGSIRGSVKLAQCCQRPNVSSELCSQGAKPRKCN